MKKVKSHKPEQSTGLQGAKYQTPHPEIVHPESTEEVRRARTSQDLDYSQVPEPTNQGSLTSFALQRRTQDFFWVASLSPNFGQS